MYNGIGLLTPRGSGTSGYVTSNRFNLRRAPVQQEEQRKASEGPKQRKPNEDILAHNKKREIEVKLFELRLKLEDEDKLPPSEVEELLKMERAVLEEHYETQLEKDSVKPTAQETHEVARRKMEKMERWRRALGIRPSAKEGEAFDQELQERRKQEAVAMREEMDRERRRYAKDEKQREVEEPMDRREAERKKPIRDDRLKSREKRKSQERSPERGRLSPGREERREPLRREDSDRPRDRYRRDERWMPEMGRPMMDRPRPNEMNDGGRNYWPEDRGRPYYPPRRFDGDGPPPDYRFQDPDRGAFRGRYMDRGRFSRGRGRRFPGRGFRPYEGGGPGFYRIGEAAPERYDPSGAGPEDPSDRKERWEKGALNAADHEAPPPDYRNRDEPPRPREPDAHGGGEAREKSRQHRKSPIPRSPRAAREISPRAKRQTRRPRHDSPPASPPQKYPSQPLSLTPVAPSGKRGREGVGKHLGVLQVPGQEVPLPKSVLDLKIRKLGAHHRAQAGVAPARADRSQGTSPFPGVSLLVPVVQEGINAVVMSHPVATMTTAGHQIIVVEIAMVVVIDLLTTTIEVAIVEGIEDIVDLGMGITLREATETGEGREDMTTDVPPAPHPETKGEYCPYRSLPECPSRKDRRSFSRSSSSSGRDDKRDRSSTSLSRRSESPKKRRATSQSPSPVKGRS